MTAAGSGSVAISRQCDVDQIRSASPEAPARAHGAVGVGDDAAAHPARVVGDHATDAGDVGGGGIGADAPSPASEQAVGVPKHHAGLDPQAGSVVLHPHPAPVAADVDEDRVGLGLAVEAGPAGAEDERRPELSGAAQELGHVLHVAGDGHRLRDRGGRGSRRRRSGSGRAPGSAPGRRQARRPTASAAARACPRRPSRVPRSGAGPGGSGTIVSGSTAVAVTTPATSRDATGTWTSRGPSSAAIDSRSASVSSSRPVTSCAGTP